MAERVPSQLVTLTNEEITRRLNKQQKEHTKDISNIKTCMKLIVAQLGIISTHLGIAPDQNLDLLNAANSSLFADTASNDTVPNDAAPNVRAPNVRAPNVRAPSSNIHHEEAHDEGEANVAHFCNETEDLVQGLAVDVHPLPDVNILDQADGTVFLAATVSSAGAAPRKRNAKPKGTAPSRRSCRTVRPPLPFEAGKGVGISLN